MENERSNRVGKFEVEITAGDIEKMRADGFSEADLPEIGMKLFCRAPCLSRGKKEIGID